MMCGITDLIDVSAHAAARWAERYSGVSADSSAAILRHIEACDRIRWCRDGLRFFVEKRAGGPRVIIGPGRMGGKPLTVVSVILGAS